MLADLQELWTVESVRWFVSFAVSFSMLLMGGLFGRMISGK